MIGEKEKSVPSETLLALMLLRVDLQRTLVSPSFSSNRSSVNLSDVNVVKAFPPLKTAYWMDAIFQAIDFVSEKMYVHENPSRSAL